MDRVVLDMLAPWDVLDTTARVPDPRRCSDRLCRDGPSCPRPSRHYANSSAGPSPRSWETMQRGWNVVGLAVRPQHNMRGHTAFLISARRLAPGTVTRRPFVANAQSRRSESGWVVSRPLRCRRRRTDSNSISGRAATSRSAASRTATTCALSAGHNGHSDTGRRCRSRWPGLGCRDGEFAMKFGDDRPDDGPLLFQ